MINKIMSKNIIFGLIDYSVKDVAKLMKENNIGFIPIKDKDKYVGVITDRDICLAICTMKDINDCIKPYMTNNIICIESNSTINEALKLMAKHKIKRLIVKEDNTPIGILSISDILNYTNNKNIINIYKSIFCIKNNKKSITSKIDDFYL